MDAARLPRHIAAFAVLMCAAGSQAQPISQTSAEREFVLRNVQRPAGSFQVVEARQLNADILLTILDSAGRVLATADAPTARLGNERVLVQVPRSGVLRITWRPREEQGSWGHIEWTIRDAPRDSGALAALRLETQAAQQYALATVESRQQARDLYSRALERWRASGQRVPEAETALRLAWLEYQWFENWQEAATLGKQAAQAFADRRDPVMAAAATMLSALADLEVAQTAAAPVQTRALFDVIARLQSASKEFGAAGMEYERAFAQNNVGLARHFLGQSEEAVNTFTQVARDFATQKERAREAMALQNIGWVRFEQGDYLAARTQLTTALDRMSGFRDPVQQLGILNNLAVANSVLGDFERAIQIHREGLELAAATGEESERARALHGLGMTYVRAGDSTRALQFLQQALTLRRGGRARISTLLAIGNLHRESGNLPAAARAHEEAGKLATLPRDRARTRVALARDRAELHDDAGAVALLDQAVTEDVGENNDIIGVAQMERGRILQRAGKAQEAARALDAAIQIHTRNASPLYQAQSYALRARLRRTVGDDTEAAHDIDRAIQASERGRARLTNPDLRATYLAGRTMVLEEKLLQLHSPVASLLAMERWRAASLRDRLHNASSGVDPALDAKRRELEDSLVSSSFQLDELRDRRIPNAAQVAALTARIAGDESALDALDMRQGSADALAFDQKALARLQAKLGDTTVLAFFTGTEASWRWAVTRGRVQVHRLPGRAQLLGALNTASSCWRRAPMPRDSSRGCWQETRALSDTLLAGADIETGTQNLAIIPDGFLSSIPFGALIQPDSQAYLLEKHAVFVAPALSLLDVVPGSDRVRGRSLAIVADPIYARDDDRLPTEIRQGTEAGDSLQRLPGSAEEARALAAVWPRESRIVLGAQARRDVVLRDLVGRYGILHFATHIALNEERPDLSRIELSRFDSDGRPLLSAIGPRDFRSRSLDADLVVLSGCESALGRQLDGEGVLGFQQSLMGAGARNVVASLWRISDRSAHLLMTEFYRNLQARHAPPQRALRIAQLTLLHSQNFAAPFHWAAFQLYSVEINTTDGEKNGL